MSVGERNIKLLFESVIYIAINETVTCILQRKQLCTAESTTCIAAKEAPTYKNTMKIVIYIVNPENATYISAAESYNSMIATETVTYMTVIERSSNITVIETTTCIVAIEPQNLDNRSRRFHLHNSIKSVSFIVPTETTTCRIDYIQKLSLEEIVPARDSFSYNREIEPMSKYQV